MKLQLKKVCASVLSGMMMCSIITAGHVGSSQNADGWISQLSGIAKVEPFTAEAASAFRRPISNESPMWIVHIDSWNYADPEKIIELVPEDILPYVVFNISLSINWSSTEHRWLMIQDGAETARSWMKSCADKGVWTMIQPASGGQCHFPDYPADYDLDNTIFGEFFRDYPNFIGFNYAEQFWGFASEDFPVTYQQRYDHFSALLKLCNKYGGYLDINWCENQWGSALNPVAMLKTNSNWEKACRTYSENLILEEKYTQVGYIEDVESEVYGAYISGYCGNYGVRWDDTGWTDYPWKGGDLDEQSKNQYRLSTSLPVYFERMAMNGMTVIDGPELVWADCIKGLWDATDNEGYKIRQWEFFDQCANVNIDIMRKFIDGTIRIPDRQEVIDRTKVVVIQDVNSGSNDDKYCSYKTLFEGLYRMDNDGNYKDNHNPFKSTGRYQTIPTIYGFADDMAKSIPVQIKQSQIAARWASIEAKQQEFNKLYPSEFIGNCYAGRNENTWVTYNPNKVGGETGAILNLKYNTCKTLDIKHQLYGSALINEYTDHIDVYMNNYDEEAVETLKTEKIIIAGASTKPSFTYKDRGVNQTKSVVTESWENGEYTLTIKHNGPIDISIKCSGNETGRQTSYKKSVQTAPQFPDFYTGIRQYEGENFDMKNVEGNVTNGCHSDVTKFQGMGFVKFGTKDSAAVRDTVKTSKAGTFKWTLRYSATSDINCVDLYVNGTKVKTLSLPKGSNYSDWKTISENINLKAGENKIELKANSTLPCSLYIDNFKVEGDFGDSVISVEPLNGKLIKNLVVNDKENAADWSINEKFTNDSVIFGDRNITATDVPANLIGAEAVRTACDSKMFTNDLATFKAGDDMTVYVAIDSRVVPVLPEWLGSWEKTGDVITATGDLTFEVYKKNVKSGETVTLGMNGGNGDNANYIVLAKNKEIVLDGKLIKNLQVFDSENGDDWSIYNNTGAGSVMFGDRDLTAASFPDNLVGAETIRTACDSKLITTDLGIFTAGADITVYVAMDSRVANPVPDWLKDWKNAGVTMSTSNELTLMLYKKNFKSGETVTLGTNSGNGDSVNYVVMAVPVEKVIKGDVNLDGVINAFDITAARSGVINDFTNTLSYEAADVDENGIVEAADLKQIQDYVLAKIKKFTK
ncbi:MAG: carbohydrate-binding protein [Ruminococcus sp.]|nr:carbohydrate-binding protein [Ruminococcus sp.]